MFCPDYFLRSELNLHYLMTVVLARCSGGKIATHAQHGVSCLFSGSPLWLHHLWSVLRWERKQHANHSIKKFLCRNLKKKELQRYIYMYLKSPINTNKMQSINQAINRYSGETTIWENLIKTSNTQESMVYVQSKRHAYKA